MLYSERLLFKNANGESINIGYDYDLIPLEFDDAVDNELNTTKFALQDGSTFVSSALSDRLISILVTYPIKNAVAIEKEVLRVFNPTIEGTLYKINSFGTKQIAVRLLSAPHITRMKGRGEITIDLKACYPFYQTDNVAERLSVKTPLLRFPMYWTTAEQRLMGLYADTLVTKVANKGDIATGFVLTFKARGTVKNPAVQNTTTGERIVLNYTMEQGDEVQVVNMPFFKEVRVNGEKRFTALNRTDTKFFMLAVGLNTFQIEAEQNVSNLTAVIEYAPKYLG